MADQGRILSTDPNAGQIISSDPNAGTPLPGQVLSSDPNAGRSIWGRAYDFLTTPQAPEITSPAREQHPWATAAYERFIRPASSVVGGALTGLTTAVGGPLIQAFPKTAGAVLGGLGLTGAAQVPGDIGEISREGFTPENTMALLEHGTTALATVPGAAMVAGKLGGRRPPGAPALPAPVAITPEAAVAAPAAKPRISAEDFLRMKAEREAGGTPALPAPVAAPVAVAPPREIAPSPTFGGRGPASVAEAERVATAMGEEIPVARPIEQRKLVEESMARRMPEAQRDDFLKVIDENDGFQAARRDVQPVERTKGIARYLEVEKEKLAPGSIRNAEETTAVANALATVNDRISTLATKIADDAAKGISNDAEKLMLLKARTDQAVLTSNYLGIRAEQGRALNMHKQLAEILRSGNYDAMRKVLKSPGVREMPPEQFAEAWAKLGTDQERMDWARAQQKMTFWQKAQAVFYANILSGIKTSERNVFGTGSNALFHKASHFPAVAYDVAESKILNRPRTVYMGEVSPQLEGATVGLKQGWDNALFTLRHGYTPRQLDRFDVPRPELGPLQIGKFKLGETPSANPFNYPGRALEAQDALTFEPIYQSELYGRLYAKAQSMGLTGDKRAAQMVEWKLNPPDDIRKAAEAAAQRILYRDDPGRIVQWLMDGKQKFPALGFLAPFIKIPASMMRQAVEHSPGGAFLTAQGRAALRAGGRERAEAVGRMVAGTTALGLLAYWAAQGKVSGAGPRDPEQRAKLMEEGWRPNSVKIGDRWIDYQIAFQPISVPLSAVANAFEIYHSKGQMPSPGHLLASIGGSALDQSFLAGLSDFNSALTDPERAGQQYLQRMTQSFVPFSGLSRNVAQAIDSVVREPKTIAQGIASIIPGVSTTVPAKISRFGEEVERPGGPLTRGFSPVTISPESQDPLIKELGRLKISSIGLPPKTLQESKNPPMPKIDLTMEERQQIGRAVRTALEQVMANPSWKQIPDEAARDIVARTVQQARYAVTQQIRAKRFGGQ